MAGCRGNKYGMFEAYTEPLSGIAEFEKIKKKLKNNRGQMLISGCIRSQKEHLAFSLANEGCRAVFIAENELKAREIFEDYRFYNKKTFLYPAKDLLFYQADVASNVLDEQRVSALKAVLTDPDAALVMPVAALM